ncbi:MAG: flagellar FlbD family protein [Cyanobacteria bacterium RYN_339]|nr:flagellar FlbD family protein [Cyanobacteria bacterium RYN_339]
MIKVTRLNGSEMMINADLIETVEATPDTVLTTTNDKKWVVKESPEELIALIVAYKRMIYGGPLRLLDDQGNTSDD